MFGFWAKTSPEDGRRSEHASTLNAIVLNYKGQISISDFGNRSNCQQFKLSVNMVSRTIIASRKPMPKSLAPTDTRPARITRVIARLGGLPLSLIHISEPT